MSDDGAAELRQLLDRHRAGELAVRDELLRRTEDRLLRLTRKLLRQHPRLRRFEESRDVLQQALLRLQRSLTRRPPETVEHFFRLAALEIRHALIDLVRQHFGPHGAGTQEVHDVEAPPEPPAGRDSPLLLLAWEEFHQKIETLPAEERQVFELRWYHGLSVEQSAEILGRSVSWIKRYWAQARQRLAPSVPEGDAFDVL